MIDRLMDRLPDYLTTTVQGLCHLVTNEFDLAAIPPRRRRRFDITRTKYKRRHKKREALYQIGGIPSVLDIVGEAQSRYVFDSSPTPLRRILPRLCIGGHTFEILELYSLDRYQQWNLDRPEAVRRFHKRIDDFLHRLHAKCESTGLILMIVSDHGHEPIRGYIDLPSKLATLELLDSDFSYFLEVSNVRFWFHTTEAQRAIKLLLSRLDNGTMLSFCDMHRYGIPLEDTSYGALFYYLDPGYIFYPHDFHHGLANIWLGLRDPMQRSRLWDPRHKGNHGHLPQFDAENAFVVLLDSDFEAHTDKGNILDIAPSILSVLNLDPPPTMKGRALFRPKA
jgi:hypothetical protein